MSGDDVRSDEIRAESTKDGDRASPARLRDLTPAQRRTGLAAWLGWLFDGLDIHLYTIVAVPFVARLIDAANESDPEVKRTSAWIQAAFLLGWALGGGIFGRLGDVLGRSRALSLTILTYACFTGLSAAAQTWWQLLIFRFLAALGIGGEWAVGASLLAETWPKRWRPWIAAVLQTGVNIGVLLACLTGFLFAGGDPRWVFLVGVIPAGLVFWIRRSVPEPEVWREAAGRVGTRPPGLLDLFVGPTRRVTLLALLVCALSLTAWWAYLFWSLQHLRGLRALVDWSAADRDRLVSASFFLVILASVPGNFFAAYVARRAGYRRATAMLFFGFALAMTLGYSVELGPGLLLVAMATIGFFSGVFSLFTMYLPPLFPTLLRTTGAGFTFNSGRVAAAIGTVLFGLHAQVTDLRQALFLAGFLLFAAAAVALLLPDLEDEA